MRKNLQTEQPFFQVGDNQLFLGDCLEVMRGLAKAVIDLIYIDPPFCTGRDQDAQVRDGDEIRSFADTWAGGLPDYLAWLEPRLKCMRDLLTRRGSIIVHLDWHASHHVKCLLDRIFGYERFRNEIVWHYGSGGRASRFFSRKHDVLLWYSRSSAWTFNKEAVSLPRNLCPGCGASRPKWNHLKRHVDDDGRVYRTIKSAGKTYRYYDDDPAPPSDVWLDINHLQQKDPERLQYPTQKPEALLRRVLASCSRPGDLVADFFCGSGTTLAVAHQLDRRWLGCDSSRRALEITAKRLVNKAEPMIPDPK